VIIGVLTTSYPRTPEDPAGHFVRGFADWLARHVGRVEVLALDAPADPTARLRAGGLPDRLRGVRGIMEAAAITARLAARVRRHSAGWDAIVSHWLLPCGVIGDAIARRRRHLAIAHGSDVRLLERLPGGRAMAARIARRADLVYVADALSIPGAPGRVIAMPPLHAAGPRTLDEQRLARAALDLPPPGQGPLVVLYVGRMVPDKGVDLLLEAVPAGALVLLVGDGPMRPPSCDRVRVLGARFGEDLRRCLAAADLLVVPSRRDGSPTVIAEARTAGVPVLGTDVGGIAAAIGRDGRVVEPTSAAIKRALETFSADRAALPTVQSAPPSWGEIGPRLWDRQTTSPAAHEITTVYY
jgi:glycosyltransferase involved in cell wall biosynthesis